MAINQLIARGVAPIGQDLPQVGNMLQQMRQQQQQNALAEQQMGIAQQNASQYQRSLDMQTQAREQQIAMQREAEARDWITANYDAVKARPDAMPKLLAFAKARKYLPPEFPDNATLDDVALHFGVQAPQAPAPIEAQTIGGFRVLTQGGKPVPGGVQAPERPQTAGGGDSAPSTVQEYRYFKSLPPEQQEEYIRVKRGEPKPSSALEKRLFDVNDSAFKSRANVERYTMLAGELERAMPAGGVAGSWAEKLKEVTGSQDAVTELRTRWNEIRVSAAINNLPPGVASDKDIQLAMSAFLPANANAATISSFLRGLAKVEAIKADYHEFEADFLSDKKTAVGLNQAWRQHAAATYQPGGSPAASPAAGGNVVDFGSLPP